MKKWMHNKFIYKIDFFVNDSEFDENQSFHFFSDEINEAILKFNSENNSVQLLLCEIKDYKLLLFACLENNKESLIQSLRSNIKKIIYNAVFLYSDTRIGEDLILRKDLFCDVFFKKVSGEFLFMKLKQQPENIKQNINITEFIGNIDTPDKLKEDEITYDELKMLKAPKESLENFIFGEKKAGGFLPEIIGWKEYKLELLKIKQLMENSGGDKGNLESDEFPPIHIVFTIEEGMGITTALECLGSILEEAGNYDFGGIREIKNRRTKDYDSPNREIRIDEIIWESDSVAALFLSSLLSDKTFEFDSFLEYLWAVRGKKMIVIIIEKSKIKNYMDYIRRISSKVDCRHIDFPEYTDKEWLQLLRSLIKEYGFYISVKAENKILKRIKALKKSGCFENIRTLQRFLERIRNEVFTEHDMDYISAGPKINSFDVDFSDDNIIQEIVDPEDNNSNLLKELDALIGLKNVKAMVSEITAYVQMNQRLKELGIKEEKLCYHMTFAGNPGTGKTTVARIIGKLFKNIGFLKKGDLVEVSRDGLVGKYLGSTAHLVKEKVNKAKGSILFIDEAGSLYNKSEEDYGYEAINVLTKEMEDNRDNMIVIMAGYKEDMGKLLGMNSGLRNRIPFQLEFEDYDASELMAIFLKCLGEHYNISGKAKVKIEEYIEKVCRLKDKSVGNGRFCRNLAEKLKIKHAIGLSQLKNPSQEQLLEINDLDVAALLSDSSVQGLLERKEKKIMGFSKE